jgi:transcriptional regulator with XRE-family HTH domain
MTYSDALSAEIRAAMGRRRISGRELARRVAASMEKPPSDATVARMLRGDSPWDVNTLDAVARILEVTTADLIRDADKAMADSRCDLPSGFASVSSQVSGLVSAA